MEIVHRRYRIEGRVQGVGFRYRACHAASTLRLSGFVRNENDGSVTLDVQGKESEINKLFQIILSSRYIFIDFMKYETLPLTTISGFHTDY